MQIENVIKMLSDDEKEVIEILFKDRLSRIKAYTQRNIPYNMYYAVRNKVVWLTAYEMGFMID